MKSAMTPKIKEASAESLAHPKRRAIRVAMRITQTEENPASARRVVGAAAVGVERMTRAMRSGVCSTRPERRTLATGGEGDATCLCDVYVCACVVCISV